ncbi:MAG: NAD(P)/FAD-dependent oxidoreductase, partial [Candidatus Cloacimonetes bacterium]|nr:NAD(P)/FAD-dependent oxidoreductase [Candidatus Cloacimonadota bacterium]
MKVEDVVIIGSGPAGIATAIQIKRYGMNPIILEKNAIGGLLKNANFVENYPGFPDGISGLQLIELLKKHLVTAAVKVSYENVLKLRLDDNLFRTKTNTRMITSRKIVIASGTKPKKIPNLSISDDVKNKIFYEIYPLFGIKDKKIIIIGAGDAAFDYALNLGKNNTVCILNRGKTAKCLPLLWQRARKSSKISYYNETEILKIINSSDERLLLECKTPKRISKFYADYVIFAIGREPQLDFLSEDIKKNVKELERKKLLYFVGDVKNEIYRQTGICVGDGVKTAMKIYRDFEG